MPGRAELVVRNGLRLPHLFAVLPGEDPKEIAAVRLSKDNVIQSPNAGSEGHFRVRVPSGRRHYIDAEGVTLKIASLRRGDYLVMVAYRQ